MVEVPTDMTCCKYVHYKCFDKEHAVFLTECSQIDFRLDLKAELLDPLVKKIVLREPQNVQLMLLHPRMASHMKMSLQAVEKNMKGHIPLIIFRCRWGLRCIHGRFDTIVKIVLSKEQYHRYAPIRQVFWSTFIIR